MIPPGPPLDSDRLKLLGVQGVLRPAEGQFEGARNPLKDFFSSLTGRRSLPACIFGRRHDG